MELIECEIEYYGKSMRITVRLQWPQKNAAADRICVHLLYADTYIETVSVLAYKDLYYSHLVLLSLTIPPVAVSGSGKTHGEQARRIH